MRSISLTLPKPVSANMYWRTRVVVPKKGRPMAMTYVSEEAKAFKEQVTWIAKACGVKETMKGRFALDIKFYPHRPLDYAKRQRDHGALWDDTVQAIDLGNVEKVLSDALQGVVIENDKFIRRLTLERMEPDGECRVVVTVTELQVEQPQQSLL